MNVLIGDIGNTITKICLIEVARLKIKKIIYFDSNKNSLGLDMLVGARKGKEYHGSFIKFLFRKLLKFLVEWTTGRKITDINSGLRIFSKKIVTTLPTIIDTNQKFNWKKKH